MTDPLGPTKYSAVSCRAEKALRDEGVPPRPAMAIEGVAACSARQRNKLAPDIDVVTQDLIDRECRHARSPRGNENISLVNMVTLPPHQQATPSQHAPSPKPSQSRAPASRATPAELIGNVPGQTRRVEYPDSQQPRVAVETHWMSAHAHATCDSNEAARLSCGGETESAIDELPLYDTDCEPQQQPRSSRHAAESMRLENRATSHGHHRMCSTPTRVRFKIAPPLPDSNAALGIDQADATPHLSLESLASLDVYGELPHSATATTGIVSTEATKRSASMVSNPATQPKTIKGTDGHSRKGQIVKVRQSARSPIRRAFVDSGSSEKRPLSDILGLRNSHGKTQAEPSKVVASSGGCGGAKRSLDGIIAHYAQQLRPSNGANVHSTTQQAWQVCFEMVRGLRLLRNDFYICELERIFRNVRFLSPESGPTQSPPKSDLILVRNREQLKLFLHEAIVAHPAYVKSAKPLPVPCSNSEDSVFEPLPRVDQLQYPSLQWLIDVHLPLFVCGESRQPTAQQARLEGKYWTRHAMPQDMKRALDKFVPVVKKYTGVLSQFFARGAGAFQHPSVGAIDPRDYRMTRRAFFGLMKQARVFPQLFHRRELECAFGMSVMTDRAEDAVNFPEFVELLARCSSSLQWGTSSCLDTAGEKSDALESGTEGSSDADTTSVIKFLMLIFAMEGRGSVLRKRSEDLDVVIEFLNHQQQQSREHKMQRFKKLLVQQEAARRVQRKERAKQATSPIAKVLSLLSASKRAGVRSPSAAVAPSPVRTFDDLTHSWDSEYHATLLPTGGGGAADAQHVDGDRESVHEKAAAEGISIVEPSRLSLSSLTKEIAGASRSRTERLEHGLATCEAEQPIQDRAIPQIKHASASTDTRSPREMAIDDADSTETGLWTTAYGSRAGDTICDEKDHAVAEPANEDGNNATVRTELFDLSSPLVAYDSSLDGRHSLSKNDFLDEILSSIGDVELLLHQSSQQLERRRPSKPTLVDDTLHDGCNSDQQGHDYHSQAEPFDTSTDIEPLPTDFLLDQPNVPRRPASSSFSYIASDLGGVAAQCGGMYDDSEDVQVKDAMLDYLTDVARFSESDQGQDPCMCRAVRIRSRLTQSIWCLRRLTGEAATITSALSDIIPVDLY